MITTREAAVSIFGACQFAKFDRAALRYFDNTPDAFWKSLYAALFALPAYVLLQLIRFSETPVNASDFRILCVESSGYVIGWVLFPLVMIPVADALNRFGHYYRFLAAWNWAIVLQLFLLLAVTALVSSETIPLQFTGLVSFLTVITILVYQGFIVVTALDVRPWAAFLIVSIDLILSLMLNFSIRSFYGGS